MPQEMRILKNKLQQEAKESKLRARELKDEEIVNPWLITEIDGCRNEFVKETSKI